MINLALCFLLLRKSDGGSSMALNNDYCSGFLHLFIIS